ncbi:hypothetical protein [Draconibacterium orientale]|uniref:hypothetical protein n=1 Tax=Draconibacterium orientale TaxID=1168034 RepID=UPI002A0A374B|nr:hypothetical protein [Draconibacterium orientale]
MFSQFLNNSFESTKTFSQFFDPTVIAALIAAIVALCSVLLNFRSLRLQRLESERKEIYKKLNNFYGPMRLNLKNSENLYEIFRCSLERRLKLGKDKFRTLPYIFNEGKFTKTEAALLAQIVEIGENMERLIINNAGLIDDDNLHEEMIKLSTHIRILRYAYKGEYETGIRNQKLFDKKTFPIEITQRIDAVFEVLKRRLDKLNKSKYYKKLEKKKEENEVNNFPCPELHDELHPEDSQHHQSSEE